MVAQIPRPLRIRGKLWIPPRPISQALFCRDCDAPLEYRDGCWSCPNWHNGLVSKAALAERLRPVVAKLRLFAKIRHADGMRELVERLAILSRFITRHHLADTIRNARGSALDTNDLLADLPELLPDNPETLFRLVVKPDRTSRHWQSFRERALPAYVAWAAPSGRFTPDTRAAFRRHLRDVLREETKKLEHFRDWTCIAACCDLAQRLGWPMGFSLAWHDVEAEIEERRRDSTPAKGMSGGWDDDD